MLKEEYFDFNLGIKARGILITKPVDLDFEKYCLQRYISMVKMLLLHHEKQSTLENDLKLLASKENPLTGNKRMAVVYRSERKMILKN